ncbi:MAG: hypothetical protein K940chlam7_00227 [Chlamydiae bacterium]|nr:hypothetical protein [Chlamydiota bacterium]
MKGKLGDSLNGLAEQIKKDHEIAIELQRQFDEEKTQIKSDSLYAQQLKRKLESGNLEGEATSAASGTPSPGPVAAEPRKSESSTPPKVSKAPKKRRPLLEFFSRIGQWFFRLFSAIAGLFKRHSR